MWEYYCRTNLALGHWGNVGNFLHHIFSAVTLNAWYLLGIECYGGKIMGYLGNVTGIGKHVGNVLGKMIMGYLGNVTGIGKNVGNLLGKMIYFLTFCIHKMSCCDIGCGWQVTSCFFQLILSFCSPFWINNFFINFVTFQLTAFCGCFAETAVKLSIFKYKYNSTLKLQTILYVTREDGESVNVNICVSLANAFAFDVRLCQRYWTFVSVVNCI